MKQFDIPVFYKSNFISGIKELRRKADQKKRDFSPTLIDFGSVRFLLPRHFGFCYGVENAIEIAYKAIEENPDKNIFLLSQMIHNPHVNNDLIQRGVRFIMDTHGNMLTGWDRVSPGDIVIIPAFGTSLETMQILEKTGAEIHQYDTTCPFVERVWKKAEKIAAEKYTIIIHGKHQHEETRATFSHARKNAPALVILNMDEAQILGKIILGSLPAQKFYEIFKGRFSEGFDVSNDLQRIGIVNQTTMLASETKAIADYLRQIMIDKYGEEHIKEHFADTRDTLCYATNDNQTATLALFDHDADLAIVVGGYNSSNTSHLVELLEQKFPVYFIANHNDIQPGQIRYFDIHRKEITEKTGFLPDKNPLTVILTSGASCPDSIVEQVMDKILSIYGIDPEQKNQRLKELTAAFSI
ncbi:MAG: 4-hydroxy-3-methylbut-2-enyl diphosphate reductase [Vicingaceae bacterium]|nr:MAG: 4-hydroxy-3-methylbut-2-enyl diphosphate reductase [Vicingaceae bacterium]